MQNQCRSLAPCHVHSSLGEVRVKDKALETRTRAENTKTGSKIAGGGCMHAVVQPLRLADSGLYREPRKAKSRLPHPGCPSAPEVGPK